MFYQFQGDSLLKDNKNQKKKNINWNWVELKQQQRQQQKHPQRKRIKIGFLHDEIYNFCSERCVFFCFYVTFYRAFLCHFGFWLLLCVRVCGERIKKHTLLYVLLVLN